MAISVTCSECGRKLKVPDQFEGKRVKCPGCGASFVAAVPPPEPVDEEPEEPAAEQDDMEDEQDRKPRKKKKKKKKSNTALIWGAVAGGALVLLLLLGVGGFLLFNKAKPQEQAKGSDKPAPPPIQDPGKQPPEIKGPDRPKGGIPRGMDIQEVKNVLKQLGLAYQNYTLTNNKPPHNREALRPLYENSATIDAALTDGWLVFIWNASPQQMTQGTSNTLLAYERDADNKGLRVVLYGDGHVDVLNEAEFQAAPRAQPRK